MIMLRSIAAGSLWSPVILVKKASEITFAASWLSSVINWEFAQISFPMHWVEGHNFLPSELVDICALGKQQSQ